MSWLGLGEASAKFSTVLIVFVCAIAVSWTVGTARGHYDATAYAQEEARWYQEKLAQSDAELIDAKLKARHYQGVVDKMLSVPGELVFDCVTVD